MGVLRLRDFRLLLGAQAVSHLGDRMVVIALAFAVLELGGSASEVGVVLACRMLPMVATLLVGGVVADRMSRRALMIIADLVRLVLQSVIAALLIAGSGEIWMLAVLSGATGAASGFSHPAATGLLPAIVPAADLQRATGVRATALSAGEILGPALAGVLIAVVGPGWALAVDAGSYAFSAACLALLRLPKREPRAAGSFLTDLHDGWGTFRSMTWVWTFVLAAAIGNVLWGAWSALGPVVAQQSLGGAAAWGSIMAALGVGAVAGSLLAVRARPRRPLLQAAITFGLFFPPLAALAAGASVAVIAAVALLAGVAMTFGNALWEAALMRHVPDESLSRVSAYDWFGSLAFQPLGLVIWGPISEVIGLSPALWLSAVLGLATTAWVVSTPAIRNMREPCSIWCVSEHVFVPYVELHAHTAFSFLDGASLPAELAAAAAELGHEAMAVVDHNGVSGSMEFAQAAAPLGLRAIHGVEISLEDERHVTLLVEDAVGWRNLCRIVTRAHVNDRDPREPPPAVPISTLEEHCSGLVCLSGCADHGVHDEPTLLRLLSAFGPDHLRVELQRPFQRHDRARNRSLAQLAQKLGVPTVATGNVHTHARTRAPLQDAFVALRHHLTLDASEPVRRGNTAHVLASPAAMAARFEGHANAVEESGELAARLRFDLTQDLGYRYPGAEDPQAPRKLAELCWAMMEVRYPGDHGAAHARLTEELRVIDVLGLAGFFLLHRDLLELAREVAVEVRGPSSARALLPPGRGRGSSVSSIVCYLTGLSHIDPIANDLFLGRFLNEELNALPDIDLDFPRDVREKLIPRVHDRYGKERSALVAAFPTFRSRGAIRELGKVLGLPPGELERVARGAEPWAVKGVGRDVEVAMGIEPSTEAGPFIDPDARAAAFAMSTSEWMAMVNGKRPDQAEAHETDPSSPDYDRLPGRWAWLARLCDEAYGLPRHLSQHSGGMIVSTRPLIDCCPVLPAAMEGRQLCQWDKDSCADAGFLKIDLLGLGMLSAVERCVEEIGRVRGTRVDLSRIPYDDEATYDAIQVADTMGVFQIESRAQMASLLRTRPRSLEDLTIQVAIVRPGPILGGAVNPYISRLQTLRENPDFVVPYEHECLREVLKDTLGTIIFQDQVIEVAMAFAGFSPGEAEGLRRAMSRKRSAEAIEAYHQRFLDGAAALHGVAVDVAERVYGMIVGFSGFGFPKAHGAAFGLLAYQSTWLRVHHGPEFLCALLNEQPMGFYAPDTLAHEAQRRGIALRPADVNASDALCKVEWVPELGPPPAWASGPDPARGVGERGAAPGEAGVRAPTAIVRLGLGFILGVREEEVRALVAAREESGPFRSLADLASRAGAGRPSLDRLAWAGACDSLIGGSSEHARRTALWQLGVAVPGERVLEGTQLALPLEVPDAPALRPLTPWESMIGDYATTGLTLGPHPMQLLRPSLEPGTVSIGDLARLPHNSAVRLGGLVVARQRPGTAKGIVFLLLEDEFGTINLIVPPDLYEANRLTVRSEPLLLCEGRLEKLPQAGGGINVFVKGVRSLVAPEEQAAEVVALAERRVAAAATGRGEGAQGGREAAASLGEFRQVSPPIQSFASGRRR